MVRVTEESAMRAAALSSTAAAGLACIAAGTLGTVTARWSDVIIGGLALLFAAGTLGGIMGCKPKPRPRPKKA